MRYLFDTNVWIAIQRGDERVRAKWVVQMPDDIFLCAPVLAELQFGVLKSQKGPENQPFVDRVSIQHECLAFGQREARRYAVIVDALRRLGKIGKIMDMQIASVALVHGLRVVTHDVDDFRYVPDIDMEDWQA